MLYYLFDNTAELKRYAGGGANVSVELASLEPGLWAAYTNHLEPILTPQLWQQLQTAAGHETIEGNWLTAAPPPNGEWSTLPGDFDADETALLPYIRRPLALLALYEYSKISSIQMSEMGMMRAEGENMKGAYKYQENQYRDFMLHQGYDALELLVRYLAATATDGPFATWHTSPAATSHKAIILNTAHAFRQAYSATISRYTYNVIRPLIEDIEQFALRPFLGDDQYDDLLPTNADAAQEARHTTLRAMLAKAVANFAISEAISRHWVELRGNQVIQSERLEPQSYEKTSTAAGNAIALPTHFHSTWANRHLTHVRAWLTTNAEHFPLYTAYQDTLAAAAAATAEAQAAATLPARCPTCYSWCYPTCSGRCGTSSTRTGVVTF